MADVETPDVDAILSGMSDDVKRYIYIMMGRMIWEGAPSEPWDVVYFPRASCAWYKVQVDDYQDYCMAVSLEQARLSFVAKINDKLYSQTSDDPFSDSQIAYWIGIKDKIGSDAVDCVSKVPVFHLE